VNEVMIVVSGRNRSGAAFADARRDGRAYAEQMAGHFRALGSQATTVGAQMAASAGRGSAGLRGLGAQARRTGQDVADGTGRGVQAADSHLDAMHSRIGAVVGRLKDLALASGVALGAAAGAAGLFGIKLAAANETAMISFEVLLGSAVRARAFLGKLQLFAAATPFDLPSLKDAASRLLAVGVNADRIIPILRRVGDATAATGTGAEGIGRAVTALQQMSQAGKVSLEDINQLRDAGIPALDALSSYLGLTVEKLQDQISTGKIKPESLFAALETGASASMRRLDGMMARQSATLVGIWSTFKDNASKALADFAAPAIPALKRLVDFAGRAVPAMLTGLQSAGARLRGIFAGSDVPQRLLDSLRELGAKLLPFLRSQLDHLMRVVEQNREGLEKFGRFLADVVVPVIGYVLVGAIVTVVAGIENMIRFVAMLGEAWQAGKAHIGEFAKFMIDVLVGGFAKVLHGAAIAFGWIPGLGPKLHSASEEMDKFVRRINMAIDSITGEKTITIRAVTLPAAQGSTIPLRHKGMQHGGIGAGWTMLGEYGRELVNLPPGSYVNPHGRTEAIMNGSAGSAGGGVQRLEITVTPKPGSDSRLLSQLVELLTFAVRTGVVPSGFGG
jgi:tape measure domain-containing protein